MIGCFQFSSSFLFCAFSLLNLVYHYYYANHSFGTQEVKQEVIAELVDQCHLYQKRVSFLVSNTRYLSLNIQYFYISKC